MDNIAFILNQAPHYRLGFINKILELTSCHFYIGDNKSSNIKSIDLNILGDKYDLIYSGSMLRKLKYYSLPSSFRISSYSHIVLTGDITNITVWKILFLSKFGKTKTFVWTHGAYKLDRFLVKYIKKIFFGLSSGVLLYGEYAKDLFEKQNIVNSHKLHVIGNAIDNGIPIVRSTLKTDIYTTHFRNNHPVIIFIGRLELAKKLEILIEAAQKSSKIFNIVLVGSGPADEILKKMSTNLGFNSRIWFYGACYDEDKISDLIFNADICVSPGFVGLTGIHSLNYGTPVITHDNFTKQMPEFEAIIPEQTGLFFKENSSHSLAETIDKWLKIYPQKTQDLVNACYASVDGKYTSQVQVKKLLKAIMS